MAGHCKHLGKHLGSVVEPIGPTATYACEHPRHGTTTLAACSRCPDYQAAGQAHPPASSDAPPTPFRDRSVRPLYLDTLYQGAACFLVCGGPSIEGIPLEKLHARGVLIASFNNNGAVLPAPIRPHIWTHSDPARKFHDAIWRDPGILKFVPINEWCPSRRRLWKKGVYHKVAHGRFEPTGQRGIDMPAVIGYARSYRFNPATWLVEPTINRGHNKKAHNADPAWPHIVNTFFSVMRLLFAIGIRTVYLLGADFRMSVDRPYAFLQDKDRGGVVANNRHFRHMDIMFNALLPHFAEHGYQVYNTTKYSGLTAFPYRPFEECLHEHISRFPQGPLDTQGWYDFKPAQPD